MKRILLYFGTMLVFVNSVIAQIEGEIVDRKGKAVSNVTLTATDGNGVVTATVKSDERGYYGFVGLKSGKYRIVAKAVGFRPAVHKNIEVKEGDTGELVEGDIYKGIGLDIMLSTDMVFYQIEGQVISQTEKGQPNISLSITDTTGKVVATTKSDNLGFFGFKGLQPGKFKIEAKAAGFRPATYNVIVKETESGPKREEDMDGLTWLYVVLRPAK